MIAVLLTSLVLLTSAPSFAVTAPPVVSQSPLSVETGEHIREILQLRRELPPASLSVSTLLSHEDINRLYVGRDYVPLWLDEQDLRPAALVLLERLRQAGEHGLCPEDYLLDKLEGLIKIYGDFARHDISLVADNRALLDLFLSQAFLTYATHLVEGQVDPSLAHVDWRARRRKADLVKLLNYAVVNERVDQVLDDLLPPHDGYRKMVAALAHYQKIAALGGWPTIPIGPTLRAGQSDQRVPVLRERLAISGDLVSEIPPDEQYDRETRGAVKRFQLRHGLVPDGVVGPKTLAALNVSASQRVRQIELNMERWRWQPKSFGRRHLIVNIADFSMKVVEDNVTVMSMPVIVGTLYRKTPVFSARMSYLEFAPYWTVPPTILREDKLPKIKRNPAYLVENHYRVLRSNNGQLVPVDPMTINWKRVSARNFPGILRMEPGPWNPLGLVKFMFPNNYNVYLHDTNERYLFNRNVLSFSSGCIRVQRPDDLAEYLLIDHGQLNCDDLLDLFESDKPRKVTINSLPVHIQYWTAWVDAAGEMQFRDDVYYRDLDLEMALREPAYQVSGRLLIESE